MSSSSAAAGHRENSPTVPSKPAWDPSSSSSSFVETSSVLPSEEEEEEARPSSSSSSRTRAAESAADAGAASPSAAATASQSTSSWFTSFTAKSKQAMAVTAEKSKQAMAVAAVRSKQAMAVAAETSKTAMEKTAVASKTAMEKTTAASKTAMEKTATAFTNLRLGGMGPSHSLSGSSTNTLRAHVDDEYRAAPVPQVLLALSHYLSAHADMDDAIAAAGRDLANGDGSVQALVLKRHFEVHGALVPLPAGTTALAAARALLEYLARLEDPLLGDRSVRTAFLDAGSALVVAAGGASSCASGIRAAGADTASTLAAKLRDAVASLRSEKRAALHVVFELLHRIPGVSCSLGEPIGPNTCAADIAKAVAPSLLPALFAPEEGGGQHGEAQALSLRLAVELAMRLWGSGIRESPQESDVGMSHLSVGE